MNIKIGGFEVDIISGGRFSLDGGTMFGVVPKSLWGKELEVDENNRIEMETNCLLVRDGSTTALIESGVGYDFPEKEREIYGIKPGNHILNSLKEKGVEPEEVDMVILSHLHFDHAGGVARFDKHGKPEAVFPNAKHFIRKREWDDAACNYGVMKSSYQPEKLKVLEDRGLLCLTKGDFEPAPGIKCLPDSGHCRGHQVIALESGGRTLVFCGDLIPTSLHVKSSWVAAYDLYPYDTCITKKGIIERAEREGWLLSFYHDPLIKVVKIARDKKGNLACVDQG